MNYETFSVWSASKGVSQSRARQVYAQAELEAAAYARTDVQHWTTLRSAIQASLGFSVSPSPVEREVKGLSALATHLRRLPGTTNFVEEGTKLVLTYTRNATHGIAYPFSDYSHITVVFDTVNQAYQTSGIVFGASSPVPLANEPGVFFMNSLELGASYNAVVRDFFMRAQLIAERYSGQNIDLFTYKLQTELRAIGVMERLDASKMPNVACFTAARVPFTAWFALSSLGVGVVKFNPALNVNGYMLSARSFAMLLHALDLHVTQHQEFVKGCIQALNTSP